MRTFTGTLGIAALLKVRVGQQGRINALIEQFAPHAEYKLGERPAHVTLYHAPLKDVREDLVQDILRAIVNYDGRDPVMVILYRIQSYGDNFLFWHMAGDMRWAVRHYAALSLSTFLDPAATAPATREGLTLSWAEAANVRDFGHPLIGPQRLPHLTLAYSRSGILTPEDCSLFEQFDIERYVFARFGQYGRLEEELLSS